VTGNTFASRMRTAVAEDGLSEEGQWLTRLFASRVVHCPCELGTFEDRGRCSGIPPCCRRWFAEVWAPLALFDKQQYDEGRQQYGGWGWGYIPCPGCRQCGARIHVRPCEGNPFRGFPRREREA